MFPKSSQYDTAWINEHSLGGNPLLGMESLTQIVPLTPEMRVLDLGCGKGLTSVFLHKEFGVQVWAVDLDADLNKMFAFFRREKVDKHVFPLRADAKNLPLPQRYFDAIFSVNSFTYYGTDDRFLPYITRFLKPGGYLAVSDICVKDEIETVAQIPECLKEHYSIAWYSVHAASWWKVKWEKIPAIAVQKAEILPESSALKDAYMRYAEAKQVFDYFAQAIQQDTEGKIQFMRLIATKKRKKLLAPQNNVSINK